MAILISYLPIIANANEQEDAVQACLIAGEAISLYDENNHVQSYEPFDETICKNTTRTKNQWGCVIQSIINGNSPIYSTNQCFRSDLGTVMIGKDEQRKAINICFEVLSFIEDKPQIEGFDNIKSTCSNYHRFAHNTKEWSCVKSAVAQGENYYFATSQCFINPPKIT